MTERRMKIGVDNVNFYATGTDMASRSPRHSAVSATTRKLAVIIWNMLTKKNGIPAFETILISGPKKKTWHSQPH